MYGARDTGLLYELLLAVEDDTYIKGEDKGRSTSAFEGYTTEQIVLHYEMLLEAKFVVGNVQRNTWPWSIHVSRLTWAGYDYLETLRSKYGPRLNSPR